MLFGNLSGERPVNFQLFYSFIMVYAWIILAMSPSQAEPWGACGAVGITWSVGRHRLHPNHHFVNGLAMGRTLVRVDAFWDSLNCWLPASSEFLPSTLGLQSCDLFGSSILLHKQKFFFSEACPEARGLLGCKGRNPASGRGSWIMQESSRSMACCFIAVSL